uniref:Uncharacterized protein n=1 Tax=Anopheles farauti TaxID=69004 RepID=A0A182QAZ3_9DIPT
MWSMFSPLSTVAAPPSAPPAAAQGALSVPGVVAAFVVESFASPPVDRGPAVAAVLLAVDAPDATGLRSGGARIGMAAVGLRPVGSGRGAWYVIPPAGWYRAVGGGGPPGPPVGGPTCGGGGPPGTACGTTPTAVIARSTIIVTISTTAAILSPIPVRTTILIPFALAFTTPISRPHPLRAAHRTILHSRGTPYIGRFRPYTTTSATIRTRVSSLLSVALLATTVPAAACPGLR